MTEVRATATPAQAWIAITAFYVLACALSWFAYAQASDAPGLSVQDLLNDPWKLLAKFGPSLAGLAVAPFVWRRIRSATLGARSVGQRLGGLFVFGLVFPGLVTLAAALLGLATSEWPATFALTLDDGAEAASWIGLRTFLGGGLGEEIGFRAVMLALLLTLMGPRWASLIVGMAWGLWHYPVLAQASPAIWVAQFLLTISLSFIFTFLFLRSGGQISLMILLHGAINGWSDFFERSYLPQIDDNAVWQIARILIFASIAIGVACLRWRPPRGER